MLQLNAIDGYDVENLLNGNSEFARLQVKNKYRRLSVTYSARDASVSSIIKVRFYVANQEAWIANIEVSRSERRRGIGRHLVEEVERVARTLEVKLVKILPFHSSVPFWEKLGYSHDMRSARVMSKCLLDI